MEVVLFHAMCHDCEPRVLHTLFPCISLCMMCVIIPGAGPDLVFTSQVYVRLALTGPVKHSPRYSRNIAQETVNFNLH